VNCFAIDPADLLKIIQAAIAPVVLISGVGLLLLTLSARLGRIVDRTRIVAAERRTADATNREMLNTQLAILRNRARLIRFALALSATSVALVSLLIIGLFLGLLLAWNMTVPCTFLFIGSLLSLVTAMLVFVRELFEALTALDLSIDPQAP
jgi:flagellar biosynthesis protein FliQ